MLKRNLILKIDDSIVGTVVDAEAVIVNPLQGKVNVLNNVATFIWEQINGIRTVGEIIALVCAEFEVDPETAEKDAFDFIDSLAERKIVWLVN